MQKVIGEIKTNCFFFQRMHENVKLREMNEQKPKAKTKIIAMKSENSEKHTVFRLRSVRTFVVSLDINNW